MRTDERSESIEFWNNLKVAAVHKIPISSRSRRKLPAILQIFKNIKLHITVDNQTNWYRENRLETVNLLFSTSVEIDAQT